MKNGLAFLPGRLLLLFRYFVALFGVTSTAAAETKTAWTVSPGLRFFVSTSCGIS
jgi:hypothetical protein